MLYYVLQALLYYCSKHAEQILHLKNKQTTDFLLCVKMNL